MTLIRKVNKNHGEQTPGSLYESQGAGLNVPDHGFQNTHNDANPIWLVLAKQRKRKSREIVHSVCCLREFAQSAAHRERVSSVERPTVLCRLHAMIREKLDGLILLR